MYPRLESRGRAGLAALAIALATTGCGGGSSSSAGTLVPGSSTPTPTPSATPTPTPTPAAGSFVGAVYAGTNNNGPGGNFVVGFGRKSDGTLVPLDAYDTGGVGRASMTSTTRLNSLIAEDSIIEAEGKFLFVVNAGTNDVTSFLINADFSLTMIDVESSGGTSPVSLAYSNGVLYVANADEDGTFTGPPDQSGNITAMRLDTSSGQLTRIPGYSLSLKARPADLEVTSDGAYLVVSALNAGAPQLPQPTAAEVSTFKIAADGTLDAAPSGTGMSTQLDNSAGRNLPNAIGIEVFTRKDRQFLVAAESRTASSTGTPGTFATLQTGSVSTWEIGANGSLTPRTQDFLLGPSLTSGPTQASFIAYNRGYGFASIASPTGGTITSVNFNDDGVVSLVQNDGYQLRGVAANFSATNPLAGADGFVDLAFDSEGNYLYQLVGLKGRIDKYDIVFSYELRQQLRASLLPLDNLQGLVVVDAR